MEILEVLERILQTNLICSDLRYCLVDNTKKPYTIKGNLARPNENSDFVTLDELYNCEYEILSKFSGIGISVNASKLQAIDVDKCFSKPFDILSADDRAIDIINRFKNLAYVEFSFSGTGLRVLMKQRCIDKYSSIYYIKNKNVNIEFYQYSDSYRYVTITGKAISDNKIDISKDFSNTLKTFLNDYMKRQIKQHVVNLVSENKTFEQLLGLVKYHCFNNINFQNVWFSKAPGSGKDESERDYYLLAYIYENITQNKDMIKELFEQSPFFKSKDYKHQYKWTNQEYRYFEYLFKQISNK